MTVTDEPSETFEKANFPSPEEESKDQKVEAAAKKNSEAGVPQPTIRPGTAEKIVGNAQAKRTGVTEPKDPDKDSERSQANQSFAQTGQIKVKKPGTPVEGMTNRLSQKDRDNAGALLPKQDQQPEKPQFDSQKIVDAAKKNQQGSADPAQAQKPGTQQAQGPRVKIGQRESGQTIGGGAGTRRSIKVQTPQGYMDVELNSKGEFTDPKEVEALQKSGWNPGDELKDEYGRKVDYAMEEGQGPQQDPQQQNPQGTDSNDLQPESAEDAYNSFLDDITDDEWTYTKKMLGDVGVAALDATANLGEALEKQYGALTALASTALSGRPMSMASQALTSTMTGMAAMNSFVDKTAQRSLGVKPGVDPEKLKDQLTIKGAGWYRDRDRAAAAEKYVTTRFDQAIKDVVGPDGDYSNIDDGQLWAINQRMRQDMDPIMKRILSKPENTWSMEERAFSNAYKAMNRGVGKMTKQAGANARLQQRAQRQQMQDLRQQQKDVKAQLNDPNVIMDGIENGKIPKEMEYEAYSTLYNALHNKAERGIPMSEREENTWNELLRGRYQRNWWNAYRRKYAEREYETNKRKFTGYYNNALKAVKGAIIRAENDPNRGFYLTNEEMNAVKPYLYHIRADMETGMNNRTPQERLLSELLDDYASETTEFGEDGVDTLQKIMNLQEIPVKTPAKQKKTVENTPVQATGAPGSEEIVQKPPVVPQNPAETPAETPVVPQNLAETPANPPVTPENKENTDQMGEPYVPRGAIDNAKQYLSGKMGMGFNRRYIERKRDEAKNRIDDTLKSLGITAEQLTEEGYNKGLYASDLANSLGEYYAAMELLNENPDEVPAETSEPPKYSPEMQSYISDAAGLFGDEKATLNLKDYGLKSGNLKSRGASDSHLKLSTLNTRLSSVNNWIDIAKADVKKYTDLADKLEAGGYTSSPGGEDYVNKLRQHVEGINERLKTAKAAQAKLKKELEGRKAGFNQQYSDVMNIVANRMMNRKKKLKGWDVLTPKDYLNWANSIQDQNSPEERFVDSMSTYLKNTSKDVYDEYYPEVMEAIKDPEKMREFWFNNVVNKNLIDEKSKKYKEMEKSLRENVLNMMDMAIPGFGTPRKMLEDNRYRPMDDGSDWAQKRKSFINDLSKKTRTMTTGVEGLAHPMAVLHNEKVLDYGKLFDSVYPKPTVVEDISGTGEQIVSETADGESAEPPAEDGSEEQEISLDGYDPKLVSEVASLMERNAGGDMDLDEWAEQLKNTSAGEKYGDDLIYVLDEITDYFDKHPKEIQKRLLNTYKSVPSIQDIFDNEFEL